MSEDDASGPAVKGQLEREAAEWCMRMHGDDADALKPAFNAWIRRGALHLEAYNKVEEVYLLGARAKRSVTQEPPARPVKLGRFRLVMAGCLVVAGIGYFALPVILGENHSERNTQPAIALADRVQLRTSAGAAQRFALRDGSWATLGAQSQLLLSFDSAQRFMILQRGSGRFEVAHDRRPFIVAAHDGRVTALGTVFEVSIDDKQRVDVRLVEGVVDVVFPSRSGPDGRAVQIRKRLTAGERASFGGDAQDGQDRSEGIVSSSDEATAQPATVGELIDLANRTPGASVTLRTADPAIRLIRLGGRFTVQSPEAVAQRLALMLDLDLDRDVAGEIVLRERARARE